MGLFDFITGGGSKESTQTKEPAPRDADQDMMWNEFMLQVFGADKLRESKLQEIEDLKNSIGSGLDGVGDYKRVMPQIAELSKEVAALPETGMSLLARMQEDAKIKAEADLRLGATAQTEGQTYIDALSQGVDAFKAANEAYGTRAGGIADEYRQNISPVISSLRPTATRAPVNLQFGDFQTPFYTGSQRYAQGQYGDLTGGLRESDLAQAGLMNLLARSDVGADAGFATNRLNQNLSTANLLNEISNANLPFTSDINYLTQYLTGQANLGEGLRYQMPTVTGSTSSDMGFLDTVGKITGIGKDIFG